MNIATLKNLTHWIPGKGDKATELSNAAAELCDESVPAVDVISLPNWTPNEAVDYKNCPATLSALSIVDTRNHTAGILDDMQPEHLYQLNHVYVPTPATNHSVILEKSPLRHLRLLGSFQASAVWLPFSGPTATGRA